MRETSFMGLPGSLALKNGLVAPDAFDPRPWVSSDGERTQTLTDEQARLVLGDKVADHLGIRR